MASTLSGRNPGGDGKPSSSSSRTLELRRSESGLEWARFASDSGDATATATWHYLFATETAIKQAGGTWTGLKNFAEWE